MKPLAAVVRPTSWIEPPAGPPGVTLLLASEIGQHTGSFKFRAAYQVAASVPHPRVITASSGNFGQALAYACKLLGKGCTVVMPTTSAAVKVAGVRSHGARVEPVDTRRTTRAARVAELAAADPEAYVASAYDDPLVIAGNATLGEEIAARRPDVVIVPVGGGGLAAGVLTGLRRAGCEAALVGAEPALANDAARSWRCGELLVQADEPATIADGARTVSLGRHNWALLREGFADVLEVEEDAIAAGLRWLGRQAGLRAEPTGALAIAALLGEPARFGGKRVVCVVSGGNVDPAVYDRLDTEG